MVIRLNKHVILYQKSSFG